MARERIPRAVRRAIVERARDCCEYCRGQARFSLQTLSVDHIIPRSLGGATEPENLALSCQGCNSFKATKVTATDSDSGDEVPLFHPRRDVWSGHFAWSDDYRLIIGTTPTGRATVEALRLNRPGAINLRRLMAAAGESIEE